MGHDQRRSGQIGKECFRPCAQRGQPFAPRRAVIPGQPAALEQMRMSGDQIWIAMAAEIPDINFAQPVVRDDIGPAKDNRRRLLRASQRAGIAGGPGHIGDQRGLPFGLPAPQFGQRGIQPALHPALGVPDRLAMPHQIEIMLHLPSRA